MTGKRGSVRVESASPVAAVLRGQEEMLRAAELSVQVAIVRETVLSVGVGVPEGASYLQRAITLGVPTARRSSGGTGILHLEGDLVWSVVLPRNDPRVGRDFVQGYARFGAGVVTALARIGATTSWVPAPGLSESCCPLGSRGFVLDLGGSVVGAAAQHLTGSALLHHGTLSLHVDRDLVARLFEFPEPAIADRLTGLADHQIRERPEQLAEDVARALADDLGVG